MSDINVTIGADARGLQAELNEINQTVEELRGKFRMSSKEIEREMQRVALSTKTVTAAYRTTVDTINRYEERIKQINVAIAAQSRLMGQSKEATEKARTETKILTDEKNKLRKELTLLNDQQQKYSSNLDTLKTRTAQLKAAQADASDGMSKFGGTMKSLLGSANQLAGVFGFGFGIYGFVRLLKSAIGVIKEFDESQKQLESVTNATSRQMETLAKQAIEIGSASKYGAAGVSELQVQLSRMGFTISEIGRMAQGITNLATAAGEDLPKAAETVAFVLRAYNLRATETTRVTDTMAYSFTQSALDLEKFRQSMKYIAPIANQANFSLEDTTALLAQLANTGISGSLAGTSLRNVLSQLADSSSKLSQRVGINVKSFEDFTAALRILNEQGTGLEEVFEVMDRRAASAFTILLKNVDTLEAFRESMNRAAGAAERMANIQKQSVTYQTKLAKAAWEGFVLSIDKGDGVLSKMIKGTLKLFSSTLNSMAKSMRSQARETLKEIQTIRNLDQTLNNTNLSLEKRTDALKRLKTEYPEYFGQLEDDVTKTDEVADSTAKATRELEANYKIRKLIAELEGFNEDIIKSEDIIDRHNDAWGRYQMAVEDVNKTWAESKEIDIPELLRLITVGIEGNWIAFRRWATNADTAIKDLGVSAEEVAIKLRKTIYEGSLEEIFKYFAEPMDKAAEDIVAGYDEMVKNLTDKGVDPWVAMRRVQEELSATINENIRQANEWIELTKGVPTLQKKNQKWLEINLRALDELNEKANKGADDAQKQNKEKAEYLRLQQKEQELIATNATSNIELERRLADIRKTFALRIAELEEDPTKEHYMRQIAYKQHLVTMQQIYQQEIREQQDKDNQIITNTQEINKLYAELLDERLQYEIATLEKRDYGTRQAKEREALQAANNRIVSDIKERSENEIRLLEQKLEQELALVADSIPERERLEELYGDRIKAIRERTDEELKLAREKGNKSELDLARKQIDDRIAIEGEILDERLAIFDAEQEQEKILFESRRQNAAAIRNFEKEQARLRLEELKAIAEARKAILQEEIKGIGNKDPFKTAELQTQLSALQRTIDSLDLQIQFEPFDTAAWEEMISALKNLGKEVSNTLKQMLKDREDAAKREREILDRQIAETQRAVDTELKLYENGFASNVELKRKELAELEKLRAKSLQAEEKAIARRRQMDAILQATNLVSAVSQIIRAESLKGLPGIALAAGGIAAMFALFNNAKKLSNTTTKYEKGGSFMLHGKSHASGGVLLAPGHEAQGGERVSVFNRSATKRFGSQIRQFTDDINRGKNPMQNINVFADNKDLKAMRKIMEREQVEYHNGYKVIRRGNVTTICRN